MTSDPFHHIFFILGTITSFTDIFIVFIFFFNEISFVHRGWCFFFFNQSLITIQLVFFILILILIYFVDLLF